MQKKKFPLLNRERKLYILRPLSLQLSLFVSLTKDKGRGNIIQFAKKCRCPPIDRDYTRAFLDDVYLFNKMIFANPFLGLFIP